VSEARALTDRQRTTARGAMRRVPSASAASNSARTSGVGASMPFL
jgi:hypothetical protein